VPPFALTRRELLRLSAVGIATAAGLTPRPGMAQAPLFRQGYQTNMWGMLTYYLLRSGHLDSPEEAPCERPP
jgi:NitT/TauT family transport system substrate-binding protein